MSLEPTTNFRDSNGVDLGKKLVTKEYLLDVYESILESTGNSGLTVTPALWGWGRNSSGQLGTNHALDRSTPVTTFLGGTNWKQVAGGGNHTAAIKTDGTLWNWGGNDFTGQLGINDTTARSTPVTTFLGGTNWKSVSCGDAHTAAIKTDGTLWTWGDNGQGQLGIGNVTRKSTPVTTFLGGTNWKSVACGRLHTTAIKTDGTLWTWGWNTNGQLGVNNATARNTPVTTILGGTNWKSVSGGGYHTTAIKTDGTLWIWGRNTTGQLGINDALDRSTPVTTFLGGTNWKQVAGGGNHTAAIKTDGTLWVWGNNTTGQLGINDTTNRSTPVTTFLGGTNWKSVSGGYFHTIALKTDGTLWTWGRNSYGQLGINAAGAATNRSTPVTTFLGGTNWKSVAGGRFHTVAILSDDYI
jgi:alpha-tubulin suppressor-like RCC1 family protein